MPPDAAPPPASPIPQEPTEWEHYKLFRKVRDALLSIPAYFDVETSISGISATEIHNLNTFLGATIEDRVVETLNGMRQVWDPDEQYSTYSFVRQAQTFPDVLLRRERHDAEGDPEVLLGIELKGWYLLAKEAVPTFRFQVTPAACAPQDLIVVVPWALSQVISGQPRVRRPYVESTRFAAEFRNHWWRHVRNTRASREIVSPPDIAPYPAKSEHIQDRAAHDHGGNFGRLARTGMLDAYITETKQQPLCGIPIENWLAFFKAFVETRSPERIRSSIDRLTERIQREAGDTATDREVAARSILSGLEKLMFPEA